MDLANHFDIHDVYVHNCGHLSLENAPTILIRFDPSIPLRNPQLHLPADRILVVLPLDAIFEHILHYGHAHVPLCQLLTRSETASTRARNTGCFLCKR